MEDWMCPIDATCPDESTCMYCGRICETTECVWTGDDESYAGFELWCYCKYCKTDTFHRLIKNPNFDWSKYNNILYECNNSKENISS